MHTHSLSLSLSLSPLAVGLIVFVVLMGHEWTAVEKRRTGPSCVCVCVCVCVCGDVGAARVRDPDVFLSSFFSVIPLKRGGDGVRQRMSDQLSLYPFYLSLSFLEDF